MLSICVKRIIFSEYVFQFIKTWGFLILNKLYKPVKLKTLMMSALTNYQSLSNLLWLLHRLFEKFGKTVNEKFELKACDNINFRPKS